MKIEQDIDPNRYDEILQERKLEEKWHVEQ
jgi:hypothetical protein